MEGFYHDWYYIDHTYVCKQIHNQQKASGSVLSWNCSFADTIRTTNLEMDLARMSQVAQPTRTDQNFLNFM